MTLVIDTVFPVAPSLPDLDIVSDTGISTSDNITSDTTPSFTMTCETGTTVTLDDGTTSYTGVCAAGTVTINVSPALIDGIYSFNVSQTDDAGNTSTTAGPLSVTIDTVAPSAPVITSPLTGTS